MPVEILGEQYNPGGPDTGKKLLTRILRSLKDNGFIFEGVSRSGTTECYKEAIFTKEMYFTRNNGDYSNDGSVTIKIDYEDSFDYENLTAEKMNKRIDDPEYQRCNYEGYNNNNANEFIKSIYDNLLTTNDEEAVKTLAETKKLPVDAENTILSYLGNLPKGGKTQKN